MCGRYALKVLSLSLDPVYQALMQREFGGFERYNIAPTATVPCLRLQDGALEAIPVRWGLVPFFSRGEPSKGYSMHNARSETLSTAGAFRTAWQRGQRCLIPATGFYEWHQDEHGKAPFFIRDVEERGFLFGGIWDRSIREDGVVVHSCSIVTLPANELMADIHNIGSFPGRMPLILPPGDCADWLAASPVAAGNLIRAFPSGMMFAYRVATRVNNARNDDASLLEATPG
jgi:putative SOS response-associated peptidase YedK